MKTSSENEKPKRSRRPFFLILGLFFLPLASAFLVYYGSNWRPSGTTNKGDLITPAIPLASVTLKLSDGGVTNDQFLRKAWTLVYVGDAACAQSCRDTLLTMRQAFQLLGKDMTRVKRVFLYTGSFIDEPYFVIEQSDMLKASLEGSAGAQLLAQFPSDQGIAAEHAGRIYIVDPLGNLMMSYAPITDARKIYQDLKKLLNLSHIG